MNQNLHVAGHNAGKMAFFSSSTLTHFVESLTPGNSSHSGPSKAQILPIWHSPKFQTTKLLGPDGTPVCPGFHCAASVTPVP